MLENHADLAARLTELLRLHVAEVPAVDDDLALRRLFQQIQTPDKRTLSGAGQPDDAEDIALFDFKADAVGRDDGAALLGFRLKYFA